MVCFYAALSQACIHGVCVYGAPGQVLAKTGRVTLCVPGYATAACSAAMAEGNNNTNGNIRDRKAWFAKWEAAKETVAGRPSLAQ
jgi:hypothetical protein